ncbi:MAG TPA: hypothetical protein VHC47_01090 [Mucilaginibacter sp.]|nr:hypothetical protein [Mucilaginibacter sp.]
MFKYLLVILLFFRFADARAQSDSGARNKKTDTATMRMKTDSPAKHAKVKAVKVRTAKAVGKTIVAAPLKRSPVKALSDYEYNKILKGEDFDHMGLSAEMNHYPMPDSALKYRVQIGLNPGQIAKLKSIQAYMHKVRLEVGGDIIRNEKMLDSIFRDHQAVDGTIIFYSNRYGAYLGELRNAALQACYKTEEVLSDAQIRKLESLEK